MFKTNSRWGKTPNIYVGESLVDAIAAAHAEAKECESRISQYPTQVYRKGKPHTIEYECGADINTSWHLVMEVW